MIYQTSGNLQPTRILEGFLFYDGGDQPDGGYNHIEDRSLPYDPQMFFDALDENPLVPYGWEEKTLCENALSQDDTEISWMNQITRGNDGPLQLLIAFLARDLDPIIVTAHHGYEDDLVHYLSRIFRQIALIPKEVRPHYFGSLANFHLNHWLEGRHRHDQIAISVQQFAPFFTLIALKTLKVGIGGHGQEREPAYEWEFDPRSSVVQHLDRGMMLLKKSEVATFLGATKSLKSFTSGLYWTDDIHEVEEGLLYNAAQTLETLDLNWYEYNRRLPQLRGFKALKDVRLRPLETRSQRTRARTKAPYRLVDLSQFMPA